MKAPIATTAISLMTQLLQEEFSVTVGLPSPLGAAYQSFLANHATSEMYHGIRNTEFINDAWDIIRDNNTHFELLTRLTQRFTLNFIDEHGKFAVDELSNPNMSVMWQLADSLLVVLNTYPNTEVDEEYENYSLYDAGVETTIDIDHLRWVLSDNVWFMVLLLISLVPTSEKVKLISQV